MSKIIATVDRSPFEYIFMRVPALRGDTTLKRINGRYEAMRSRYQEFLARMAEDDEYAEDWLGEHTLEYNSEMAELCEKFEDRLRDLQLGNII